MYVSLVMKEKINIRTLSAQIYFLKYAHTQKTYEPRRAHVAHGSLRRRFHVLLCLVLYLEAGVGDDVGSGASSEKMARPLESHRCGIELRLCV